ncbi:MAG: hypothetical protein Q9161_002157 [Pseudevernia consocians]
MKDLLRGFLAAAVTNWVIDERRVSISQALFYSTASSQAYERGLKQVSEQLHEQFLRKSRNTFINNEDNFKDLVSDLSVRLLEILKPLLNLNHLRPKG